MSYGIQINPLNGNPYIFDENTMFISVGEIGVTPDSISYSTNTGYKIPNGYDYSVIIPNSFPTEINKSAMMKSRIGSDGNIELYLEQGGGNTYYRSIFYMILLIPRIYPVDSGMYGIGVLGEQNRYMTLSDGSYVTSCLYRGETQIYTGWNPRNVFPSFNASEHVCFYYLENTNYAILYVDSGDCTIRMFIRGTNNYNNGYRVNAKVVILGKTALQPDSYGLNIWAKNGDLVFTSGEIQAGTGEIKTIPTYNATSFNNIKRPMFIPETLGVQSGLTYQICNDGSTIIGVPLSWGGGPAVFKANENPHIFIDAVNYFTF
ncbi:hypothetical protein [Pectobacterium carotovorum]|uniref:Uncharacterized protein n=1 Tax=Pectobacterium carotovorum subsp. carotovorum TaxID=555 RepID=A0AAI9KY58_PECCC|nr:hypothetical protein [Pectobacterium carotovorum]GKX45276.1 hypothetical protein SOASR016_00280 [Pectobacterium carotovorum subsp. carotovorum]GLV67584.1 hypothetical protein Pcaca03_00280 [Pectobacterium carotovorum subsp. carotovorum]